MPEVPQESSAQEYAQTFLTNLHHGAYEEAYGMFSTAMLNRINFVEMIDDYFSLEEQYGPEMELILVEAAEGEGGDQFRYLSRRKQDVFLTVSVGQDKGRLRIEHYAIDVPSDHTSVEYAP